MGMRREQKIAMANAKSFRKAERECRSKGDLACAERGRRRRFDSVTPDQDGG